MKLSALETDYPWCSVASDPPSDPTSDAAYQAFMAGDHTPTATDWYTATWRTVGSLYQVGVLVGPGGLVLPVGTYTVWVKVESTPTVVARPAGTLTIY